VVFFFVIGLFPNLFFQKITPAVGALPAQVTEAIVAEVEME
jgi:hypothetical protein